MVYKIIKISLLVPIFNIFFRGFSPVPVFLGSLAVHIGCKVADEGALVEGREVGAQKVVSYAIDTVVVDLQRDQSWLITFVWP